MLETLLLLSVIGVPAAGVVTLSLKRLGAVHAAEQAIKTAVEGDRRNVRDVAR